MNTRFSSLVTIKKNAMEKSERVVQNANKDLDSAKKALENAYTSLNSMASPQSGTMAQLLANRTLFNSQRHQITHNQEWINYSSSQLETAQKELKSAMIEYEKFKYLELEEIKKILKKQKIEEAKELDEIALMTYKQKNN